MKGNLKVWGTVWKEASFTLYSPRGTSLPIWGGVPSVTKADFVGRAKTCVARWFDCSGDQTASLRLQLLRGVEAIAQELPKRADWFEVNTVALDGGGGLPIRIDGQRHRVFQCADYLVVSSVVPGWGVGWSEVFKNEEVYKVLSWFLHYVKQYIHRSDIASALMIAWEDHGKILHPFGSRGMGQRYGPMIPMISVDHALDTAKQEALESWGDVSAPPVDAPTPSVWISRNTLDPFIHQAIFHYLRAQQLTEHWFEMEAVVAFDCVLQSIAAFLRARHHLETKLTRRQVCEQLRLPSASVELADYVYFLRNNFGAHAAGWRWWDQDELLDEDDISEIAQLAGSVLSRAADAEPTIRSVEPFPSNWGNWFFENFETLWDTLWFEKLDKWSNRPVRR